MLCLEPMGFIWIRPSMGSPQNPGCPKVIWPEKNHVIWHGSASLTDSRECQHHPTSQVIEPNLAWPICEQGLSISRQQDSWHQVAPLNGSSLDMASGRRESTGGFPIFRRSSLKLETGNFLTSTPTTAFRLRVSMMWHDPKLINSPPRASVWPWNPKVCHCLLQRMTRSIFNWKQCDPAPCIVGTLQHKCVGVFVAYILPPNAGPATVCSLLECCQDVTRSDLAAPIWTPGFKRIWVKSWGTSKKKWVLRNGETLKISENEEITMSFGGKSWRNRPAM